MGFAVEMDRIALSLEVLDGTYTIHRFSVDAALPEKVWKSSLLSITRTSDELSVVCDTSLMLDAPQKESGWSCLKVSGSLDFSLTGILAQLSTVLAEAEISLFAISTFDTDYILVKSEKLQDAVEVLSGSGYTIKGLQ